MFAQVEVINTVNVTLILSVIAAAGVIIGPLTIVFFKALKGILKEIYDLKIWMATYQKEIIDHQTAQLEVCIHKLPDHPENPANQVNPPIQ